MCCLWVVHNSSDIDVQSQWQVHETCRLLPDKLGHCLLKHPKLSGTKGVHTSDARLRHCDKAHCKTRKLYDEVSGLVEVGQDGRVVIRRLHLILEVPAKNPLLDL